MCFSAISKCRMFSGFEMLARLEAGPLVVFTTAYSQYALRAFEVNSIDYLLKPVDETQLARALNKLDRIRGGLDPKPQLEALLRQLASAIPEKKAFPSRLPSRIGERIEFVEIARITHFYANEKLTYASTPQKDFAVDYTIAELEESLDPAKFVRIHRSTIVNLDYVKELHSWFSERLLLRVNDGRGTELTVSRNRFRSQGKAGALQTVRANRFISPAQGGSHLPTRKFDLRSPSSACRRPALPPALACFL